MKKALAYLLRSLILLALATRSTTSQGRPHIQLFGHDSLYADMALTASRRLLATSNDSMMISWRKNHASNETQDLEITVCMSSCISSLLQVMGKLGNPIPVL